MASTEELDFEKFISFKTNHLSPKPTSHFSHTSHLFLFLSASSHIILFFFSSSTLLSSSITLRPHKPTISSSSRSFLEIHQHCEEYKKGNNFPSYGRSFLLLPYVTTFLCSISLLDQGFSMRFINIVKNIKKITTFLIVVDLFFFYHI